MYKKIRLPYNSLEPVIDDETLDIHYNKHYQKYIDNLNDLIGNNDDLIDVIKGIDKYDLSKRGEILYNAGGVLNHQMYFENLAPTIIMNEKFMQVLIKSYGSYDNFVNKFKEIANKLVGSGYTFLVLNQGKLDIINMSNQENPYTYGMIPLLVLDLWEHAYYLKYKNNRQQYIDNFFKIINYEKVEDRYEEATKQESTFTY